MLLLTFFITIAQAEPLLERLCFDSALEAQKAQSVVEFVLIKGQDQVAPEGSCLNVTVSKGRGELFQRWVKTRLPNARYEFSTLDAPIKSCDLMVLKTKKSSTDSQTVGIDTNASPTLQVGTQTQALEEQSILKVQSGSSSTLTIDQQEMTIACTVNSQNAYLLKFSLKALPPPVPAVTPGTVVVVPPPPQGTVQELSTEAILQTGGEIDLGEIKEKLHSRQRSVDIGSGVSSDKTDGQTLYSWKLKAR